MLSSTQLATSFHTSDGAHMQCNASKQKAPWGTNAAEIQFYFTGMATLDRSHLWHSQQ